MVRRSSSLSVGSAGGVSSWLGVGWPSLAGRSSIGGFCLTRSGYSVDLMFCACSESRAMSESLQTTLVSGSHL